MLSAHGTVTIRPREVVPVYREEWDATVTDYKYNLVNRDFVSRNGNLYQVKVQKPNEFVPAGIDPDSEIGEDYWEIFNKLAPSVTNFLVIVDEDGKPQTLLSGGRVQTRFLNIGSLNMSETRLWGGAEPMTGKGLALVNDPDDRKFVVYNDSKNYVEMFQRGNEWGLKGVINGNVDNPVFQLGSTNKICGWSMTGSGFTSEEFTPPTLDDKGNVVSWGTGTKLLSNGGLMISPAGNGILAPSAGAMQAARIAASGSNASVLGLEIIARGNGYLKEITALKLSARNDYSTPQKSPVALDVESGDINISNGNLRFNSTWRNIEMQNYSYMVGGCGHVPSSILWSGSSAVSVREDQTIVMVNNSQHFNAILPDARNLRPGHTVMFLPWQSSYSHGIATSNAKIKYKAKLYDWILVKSTSGGRVVIVVCVYIGSVNGYHTWMAGTLDQGGIEYGNN